ncbi:MAG: transglutaminase family protein [Candidatus Hodarchaeota archaeon]
MRLRFSYSFRFSRSDLRNVSIRIPIAAEHYAKNLKCHSDYPMKIFTKKGTIFSQIRFSSLPARVIQWDVDVSVRTLAEVGFGENWGNKEEYLPIDVQRYCKAETYWEVGTAAIQQAASKIDAADSKEIYSLVSKTFAFVRQSINFPEPQKDRFGALKALTRRFGDCDEFTDLFITILRTFGIPARRITGIFVRELEAENHAWAEVLLPRSQHWITMDPALGYFGQRSKHHFGRKIEDTVSTRNDVMVWWKEKRSARVKTDAAPPQILEAEETS